MELKLEDEQDLKKLKRLRAEDCLVGENSTCKRPGVTGRNGELGGVAEGEGVRRGGQLGRQEGRG